MLNYGDLPLEKQGEFRVALGAVIHNLGMIKMKSTDESGVARSIRGHITEVAKPLVGAAEVSRRWDSLFVEDGGLLFWNAFPLLLWRSEQFGKITEFGIVMARASDINEKETCTTRMRTGDVTPELTPVKPAGESWTRPGEMDVDDGDHVEQDEAEQPEELRRVLAARQLHRAGEAETFSHKSCCVCTVARSVCESKDRQSRNWQSKNRMDPECTQTSSTCLRQELRHRCLR